MKNINREYFDLVIERLRDLLAVKSDADLAEALGMKPNAFANRKKSGSIPYEEIIAVASSKGMNLDLVFGTVDTHHMIKDARARYEVTNNDSRIKVGLLQPSTEWIVVVTMAISEAIWLPDSVKTDRSAQIRLALELYNLLVLHIGNDDVRWQWMMNNSDSLQHALHFVYDLDQMKKNDLSCN